MQLQWHENPQYQFASSPDPGARSDLAKKRRASCRLWLDIRSAGVRRTNGRRRRACQSAPKVAFILQHAGMSETFHRKAGRNGGTGLRLLAARPNVVSKLSALGTFIHKNDPAHIAAVVRETIDIFGPQRCLFGSNFPVEKLWTQYADLIAAYRLTIEPLGKTVARADIHDTAARVYRLN